MKRISLISAIIAFSAIWLNAQTVFDALKAADSDLNGSARYSAMAGAFGALGGDVSAIKDNPAGLGVFRKSEISLTANQLWQNSTSQWNSKVGSDDKSHFGLNNFSIVFAAPSFSTSGLVSSNFSFSYNKLKNFNRNVYAKSNNTLTSITDYYADLTGTKSPSNFYLDDIYQYNPFLNEGISWMSIMAYQGYLINPNNNNDGWKRAIENDELVTPDYKLREWGGIDEYAFSWAGNISNRFFLGVSINIHSIKYNMNSIYNEDFTGGGGMTMLNYLKIDGQGINANLGLIYAPVDFLRIGASVHTPTQYSFSVTNSAILDYDSKDSETHQYVSGSVDTRKYVDDNIVKSTLRTPLEANGSIAILFGKKGLLSAEYGYKNYAGMRFFDKSNGSSSNYKKENDEVSNMLNSTSSFKLGGEYKVTDNIALRAGYSYLMPTTNEYAQNIQYSNTVRTDAECFINNGTRYITAGFGYRESFWYIDFAFTNQLLKETFYAFNSKDLKPDYKKTTPASVTTNFNNFIVTLGLRF